MPSRDADNDRRRSTRSRTRIQGVARTSQGARHPLEITDLSVGGCSVEARHPLAVGSAYGLKINGLEILGSTAAWSAGLSAGLEFQQPLHPAVADHLAMLHPHLPEEDDDPASPHGNGGVRSEG